MVAPLAPGQPSSSSFRTVLKALAIAVSVILVATTLFSRIHFLPTPLLNVMGEEQNVVYGLIKWMQGTPLYTDPEALPMDIIQYSPAYYYLVGTIGHVFGVNAQEPMEVYLLSRIMGLLFNLLFACSGFLIARKLGAQWWSALLWAAVLFSFLPRQVHSRPDALNLLFFSLCMLTFFHALAVEGSRSRKLLALATVLGCLAALTKQSGVLGLGVIGAYLLFTQQWRLLAQHVLVAALVLGTAVGVLCWHYGANEVHLNLVVAIKNGIDLHTIHRLVRMRFWSMMILQAIGVFVAWRWWRGTEPMQRGWAVAYVLSLAFGYFTSLKYGSSPGYYMEGFVLAGAGMAALLSADLGPSRWPHVALMALAVSFLYPLLFLWGLPELLGAGPADDEREAYQSARAMAQEFRTDPALEEGYVLLTRHDHLENFIVGRSVVTQKDIYVLSTSKANFDLSGLQRGLNEGAIRFVVMRTPGEPLLLVGDAHPPLRPIGVRHGYHIYENSAWRP